MWGFFRELLIAKKNARNQLRINVVVATPSLEIIREDGLFDCSSDCIPTYSVSRMVSYNEVGSFARIEPFIGASGVVYFADGFSVILRIA